MPSAILNRAPPESRHKLATPLSEAATASLRTMFTGGLLRPVVPPEQAQEMIAAGYAREATGGLTLTDIGQVKAMMELGQ